MADCIWMETALIASSLAEHRDIACAWVHKQGAIECDLSNETTYQELVEELRLRPLEARRLAVFFCPKIAERQQQPMKSEPDSVVPHPITEPEVSNKEPTLLPAGWVERIGRVSKKQYFFNLKNGTTQEIRPVESAYPELTERPCDLPATLSFGPVLMKQIEKALSKMPRLWNGLHAARLKTRPVSGGCFWPERLVQALGHLECAQGVVAEIFGDGVEAAGQSNTSGLSNKCTKLEIEQAAVSPKIQQLLAKFTSYGCSSDVIKRLSKCSEDVLEVALAYTLSLTNPRSPNGVAISNVRRAEAESKGWAYKKRTWSKCIWNYNQEETDCCRCQQPKDIASDCITDIQALDQSDQPIASAEGMGSGKVASTQAAPAKRKRRSSKKSNSPTKRQRRTTQKSDYSKNFSFSDI